jgi:hypothetical protein
LGTFLTDRFETVFDRIKAGLDRRLGLPLLRRKFKHILGYDLNLENPVTSNEKIQWLKFNTTGNDYVRASDKLDMPQFVRELIGDEMCEGIFTEILLETDDPNTFDFDALPSSYVIKPTHGSGCCGLSPKQIPLTSMTFAANAKAGFVANTGTVSSSGQICKSNRASWLKNYWTAPDNWVPEMSNSIC